MPNETDDAETECLTCGESPCCCEHCRCGAHVSYVWDCARCGQVACDECGSGGLCFDCDSGCGPFDD